MVSMKVKLEASVHEFHESENSFDGAAGTRILVEKSVFAAHAREFRANGTQICS